MKCLSSTRGDMLWLKHPTMLLFSVLMICFSVAGCSDSVEYTFTENTAAVSDANVVPSSSASATGGSGTMVLDEMPMGEPQTPTEIKEASGGAKSAIVAGRIDAGDMDAFLPGKLSFMISQLPDAGHGADDPDHADDCPFCKRKLENAPKAIVEFRDSNGQVLDGNARAELGVELGDVVYVTGAAEFNAAVNTVMIDASGVYRATSP